jgi:hypothetical protein
LRVQIRLGERREVQWVETNPSNICPMDVRFAA